MEQLQQQQKDLIRQKARMRNKIKCTLDPASIFDDECFVSDVAVRLVRMGVARPGYGDVLTSSFQKRAKTSFIHETKTSLGQLWPTAYSS
jgi:hypothetical protein